MKNIAIEEELKNKVSQYELRREQERQISVKRAEKLVRDTIHENIDYYNAVFSKYLG